MTTVYGNGAHGRDIADIIRAGGGAVAVYDDDPERGSPLPAGCYYLIGVADPHQRASLDKPWNRPRCAVHPSVIGRHMKATTDCGGIVIGAGTTIGPDVTLGRHTHVGAGCTITRTTVGDYCQIAPGVDIAGDVTIGDRVFIGVGATVRNLVSIGDDVTVGAGAVVLHDVPDGYTVAGIPAKVIHRRVAA